MNAYEKIMKLKEKEFKRITVVTLEVFEKMLEELRKNTKQPMKKGVSRA